MAARPATSCRDCSPPLRGWPRRGSRQTGAHAVGQCSSAGSLIASLGFDDLGTGSPCLWFLHQPQKLLSFPHHHAKHSQLWPFLHGAATQHSGNVHGPAKLLTAGPQGRGRGERASCCHDNKDFQQKSQPVLASSSLPLTLWCVPLSLTWRQLGQTFRKSSATPSTLYIFI